MLTPTFRKISAMKLKALFAEAHQAFLRLLHDRRGDQFAQTALVLPVIMLSTMGLLDMTMASFAAVNANNAANAGARVGSVTQGGASGAVYEGAAMAISHAEVGEYGINVSGGGHPGASISVRVHWETPNHMASISTLWGSVSDSQLSGEATASFRQEGW